MSSSASTPFRELLEVRVAPLRCTILCSLASVVIELLRPEVIGDPLLNFLVHVLHDLALPHRVLRPRLVFVLVLELFLREDVPH